MRFLNYIILHYEDSVAAMIGLWLTVIVFFVVALAVIVKMAQIMWEANHTAALIALGMFFILVVMLVVASLPEGGRTLKGID